MNFNHFPNINLIDKDGQFIDMVNQIQARRLLRQGLCDLLLIKPVTIRFYTKIDFWETSYLKKQTKFGPKSIHKDALKSVLYGNYRMQSPDGKEMFHTNAGRVLWYLSRDLIEVVDDNPPTLRFKMSVP